MRHKWSYDAARQRLGVPFCLRWQMSRLLASVLQAASSRSRIEPLRPRATGRIPENHFRIACCQILVRIPPASLRRSKKKAGWDQSTSTRLTPWQKYCLVPPKELLRLRSLVARGRAREKVRTRTKTPREIELLFAPSFPNELFWKVMAFWNPRH